MSFGLLTRAWSGWRRVLGIADQGVCLGCAVSLGLLISASSGWRRVLEIADQGVSRGWRRVLGIADQGLVWVAPCLWDC